MRLKLAALALFSSLASAQGTLADYQRAQTIQKLTVINAPGPAN